MLHNDFSVSSLGCMLFVISQMRRLVANSVLLVMLGIFFAPAVTAAAPQPLPICCRRGGAHHCAAMAQMPSTSGKNFRSENSCPMRQAPLLGSSVVGLPASRSAEIQLWQHALIGAPVSRCHFRIARSDRQRGPPSLLS